MSILAIRTSGDPTEFYFLQGQTLQEKRVDLGRNLSHEILREIEGLVGDLHQLTGLVVYQGPGSFTGLRIGISVMNALSYSLQIPVVGVGGEDWREVGERRLANGEDDKIVLPEYGAKANITQPKH